MSTENDQKQLKPCLTKIIELVNECLQKLNPIKEQSQPQTDTKDDNLLQNSQLNNNVYTFTLSNEENELLDTLTSDIQITLSQHFPHLTKVCSNYLLEFLHPYHYDRDQRKFTSPLIMGVLYSFHRELEGLLASVEAFPAAYNGELQIVKKFIKQYPTYKDKPGLWETTLLYSAARNNHLDIVKYLIELAHCSVNAQNQRDVEFALDDCSPDFIPRPTAASTALHGACFNNHLNVVKYLVDHGANYFIQNQANETPIMNGEHFVDIKNYFQDYLIINYSIKAPERLPDRPIMNDDRRPIQDCWWEYKPFQDSKWYKFTLVEATELHKALLPSEEFQQQVYLKLEQSLYSVSMVEFYRSGKHEQDPQKNMAWIRCRGSSVLNFDCYSIWQIMLIQHKNVDKKEETTSSLKVQHFPTMSDSHFKLQLNTWYSCNAKTNSLLDNSMNYRRKVISINLPFVGDDLKFNLQTFEFSNNEKTILGYVRWIPKLISNTESNDKKIVHVDNYQVMANIQPIPLTTKHLKDVSQIKKTNQQEKDDLANPEDEDDESGLQIAAASGLGNDDDIDDDDIDNSNGKSKVGSRNY
jgi:hypothetical protein